MPNRLVDAVSPYLRSHADNPVDWWGWGPEPFAEAAARDVPVLVSIGYSTCHWCHVMARESFSDPSLAEYLNERFVAIKVDREEHPDVDATYLAAAGAFTENLGWPLNVFATPGGKTFYAGTYFPPRPVQGHPAFRQVLEAVTDAWRERRAEVHSTADAIAGALAGAGATGSGQGSLPDEEAFERVVRELEQYEDREHGGFGTAPKFPVAPVLLMLLDLGTTGTSSVGADAAALATRTLDAMAHSDLRDEVEGGFFRYSTRRDWTDPHYERMLYDNALLLDAYARVPPVAEPVEAPLGEHGDHQVAAGIAAFLAEVLRLPSGSFASAQDSESTVDGERVEGGYYSLDAAGRARQHPPALDEKVLTGWNGLAIGALASAGARLGRRDWIDLATAAADDLLSRHRRADGTLVRASIGDRVSEAKATLEDYGMFARGLLELAIATGEVRYAVSARDLVDAATSTGGTDAPAPAFAVPGGADPVLIAHGLALEVDPSEGAYPSGVSAMAGAAHLLYLLTGEQRYRAAGEAAVLPLAAQATQRPIGFGAALSVLRALAAPVTQLVVIADAGARSGEVVSLARDFDRVGAVAVVVTAEQAAAFASAGFELFAARTGVEGAARAYLCSDFVCRLPVTDAEALRRELPTG